MSKRPKLDNRTIREAVCSHLRTLARIAEHADRALCTASDASICNRLRSIKGEARKALLLLDPEEMHIEDE